MKLINGVIIESDNPLSLEELLQALQVERTFVIELIEYEVIKPQGQHQEEWQFDHINFRRARLARNFYHDLEINLPGVALALELLERIETLEQQMQQNKEQK